MTGTKIYRIWAGMLRRCRNPNDAAFHDYGGRGIRITERWRKFENFYADMGEPPPGLSLDRINNDGNYEPSNCRWATQSEQVNNRRPMPHNRKYRTNTSGFTGVRWAVTSWVARISINGQEKNLGRFKTPESAHAAYLQAVAKI